MRCTISQLYFGKELYMFRSYLLSIIRSLNTVFTVIGICHSSYVDYLLADSQVYIMMHGPLNVKLLQYTGYMFQHFCAIPIACL